MGMQYSAALLRQRALEDVLAGPESLHADLPTRLGEVRRLRASQPDADVRPDPDHFPTLRRGRPRKRELGTERPSGVLGTVAAGAAGLLRQVTPVGRDAAHPQRHVPAADAGWWTLSRLDSALVSTTDGTGVSWHRRDRSLALHLLRDSIAVHQRLLREWPVLARRYRAALGDLTGQESWRKTLDLPAP
jgi:galactofuranosylgalactofuranosylrhamnosyl-N-acetylglucosaminyl-diphospho-decaprenol beta-1,5/1,6-galactofuranosyltransferase